MTFEEWFDKQWQSKVEFFAGSDPIKGNVLRKTAEDAWKAASQPEFVLNKGFTPINETSHFTMQSAFMGAWHEPRTTRIWAKTDLRGRISETTDSPADAAAWRDMGYKLREFVEVIGDPYTILPSASIAPMKHSAGKVDYYVMITCGDRECTILLLDEMWKAEYERDYLNWIFTGENRPDILNYGPES